MAPMIKGIGELFNPSIEVDIQINSDKPISAPIVMAMISRCLVNRLFNCSVRVFIL